MRLTVLRSTSAHCAPWSFCVQRDKCLALRDIEKWVRMMESRQWGAEVPPCSHLSVGLSVPFLLSASVDLSAICDCHQHGETSPSYRLRRLTLCTSGYAS